MRLLGRDGALASVGAMVLGYVQIMAGAPLYVQIVACLGLAALAGFMGLKMWRQTRQPGQAMA
ncbi:MAG: hypothetical protein AAGI34_15195 [Pseudomonadota bacterium]